MTARLIGFILLVFGITASAQVTPSDSAQDASSDNGRLTLVFAPFLYHLHYDANHNDEPWLTGLEWEPRQSPVEFGAVYFRNSFYQDSVYAYVGKRWFISDDKEGVFLNLTGGPLYGYRGKYEKKVPYNHHGLGVAIIPAIGYQYRSASAQLIILGTAALMVSFGYDFGR